jgi:hypothetical protein
VSDEDGADKGINEKEWLAKRIEFHFVQHGAFHTGLCLEYAQKFGVEAEKRLITALSTQGA